MNMWRLKRQAKQNRFKTSIFTFFSIQICLWLCERLSFFLPGSYCWSTNIREKIEQQDIVSRSHPVCRSSTGRNYSGSLLNRTSLILSRNAAIWNAFFCIVVFQKCCCSCSVCVGVSNWTDSKRQGSTAGEGVGLKQRPQ